MSKTTQKAKKIKNKLSSKLPKALSGYKRRFVMVEDFVMGQMLPVALYVARGEGLPLIKIVFPTEKKESGEIRYLETVTLLKNVGGGWTKSVSVDFDRNSQKIVGAKGYVEEIELGSRDIMIIAQIEDQLCRHDMQVIETRQIVV